MNDPYVVVKLNVVHVNADLEKAIRYAEELSKQTGESYQVWDKKGMLYVVEPSQSPPKPPHAFMA